MAKASIYASPSMATVHDPDHDDPDHDDDGSDEAALGEFPDGVGADLYPKHLERLSRDDAFRDGVLSFKDADGTHQEVPLDEVSSIEEPDEGSNRSKILLRNGVIVVATGAVIAGAIAAVRYRRRHRSG
jgi:hypothetical protein